MKVLIGGGTGFIGKCLSQSLEKKGYEVLLVSRSTGAGKITWTDINRQGLPKNCSAVVNLAGENMMNPLRRWNEKFKSELASSRIDTTKALANAIASSEHKPDVFVTSSAIGYYQPHPSKEYTENSHGGDFDYLSEMCASWEKAASLSQSTNVRKVTVRIGLVLGRNGGLIESMYIPFYLGAGGRLGSGKQWFPWVHVEDVTGIMTHAIENQHVSGILNAVSPEPATNLEFTQKLAKAMWRPAFIPVPEFALNCVFGEERAKAMLEGQKVVPKRTLQSGYKFLYSDMTSAIDQCVK